MLRKITLSVLVSPEESGVFIPSGLLYIVLGLWLLPGWVPVLFSVMMFFSLH